MAATLKAYIDTGAATGGHGTTQASCDNADSATITWGRDDNQNSTATIPIPTSTGTHFSWAKSLYLNVTATGTTHISNRTVKTASALATGILEWFKAVNGGSYAQATTTADTDSGSNGATPTGYTAVGTSTTQYDSASVSSGSTGQNGKYCVTAIGVDNSFAGGGGSASLPNLVLSYDEGP